MADEDICLNGQHDNTYVMDSESAAEMARLMRQERLLKEGMGGLFPEGLDLSDVHRILDVACGPGGWVLETAFAHTDIDVVGIDISPTMIGYARAQARVQGLANAHFEVMNALQPLQFRDASFDLVNTRLSVGFMLPLLWPAFVQECLRVLRPGGILRLTDGEWGFSNKAAFEKFCWLFNQALQRANQSFSPNGLFGGILPMLRHFLVTGGCLKIGQKAHVIDFSYGTELYEGFYYNLSMAFKLMQPFLIKWNVATQDELDDLYQATLTEMRSEDFCALWILLTVWGYKPA